MPLYRQFHINKDVQLGIWDITEPSMWFETQLVLHGSEFERLSQITNESRKQQWLATRLLLRKLSGSDSLVITNDSERKPCLNSDNLEISITHTGRFVAIIFGTSHFLGIDIESIRERILKIKHKFISEKESHFLSMENKYLEQLYVIWSAKESLFKLHGKGNLDFKKNLLIKPFKIKEKDNIKGLIKIPNNEREVDLSYEKIDDHFLVYCIDPK